MSAPIGGPRRPMPVDGIAPGEHVRDDERRRAPEDEVDHGPRRKPAAKEPPAPHAPQVPGATHEDDADPDKGHEIDIRA